MFTSTVGSMPGDTAAAMDTTRLVPGVDTTANSSASRAVYLAMC